MPSTPPVSPPPVMVAPPPPTPTEMPYAICPWIPITYYLQLLNSYFYIPLTIGALYFFDHTSLSHWVTVWVTLLVMVMIAIGSSYLVSWEKKRNQGLDELMVYEKHMTYSLYCIMMGGHIPAISSFIFGWIPCLTPSVTIICSFLASQVFSKFYLPTVGKTVVDYHKCLTRYFCCFVILMVYPIIFSHIVYHDKGMLSFIPYIFNQLVCTIFYSSSVIDYFILLSRGARRAPLKNNQIGVSYLDVVAKLPVDKERRENIFRAFRLLSCPICYTDYSENHTSQTPRNLACGHTVCEKCLIPLIKKPSLVMVTCPVCDRPIIIRPKLPLMGVPKNHALIDILREIESEKESQRFRGAISPVFGGGSESNEVGPV